MENFKGNTYVCYYFTQSFIINSNNGNYSSLFLIEWEGLLSQVCLYRRAIKA